MADEVEETQTAPGSEAERLGQLLLKSWILLLMSDQPTHGYQLVESLVHLGVHRGSSGYVYRTLRRMEESGILVSAWQQSECGRPHRVYQLTSSGYEALDLCAAGVTDLAGQLHGYLDRYQHAQAMASPRKGRMASVRRG